MPKGKQTRVYFDISKSEFTTECGFEIVGTPKAVSLKHKLHISKCDKCQLFHNKPIDPNVYKGRDYYNGKSFFNCSNDDMKNIHKLEKKKKEQNSTTNVSLTYFEY